jgi:ABC-type uncharacterized transport system substrate-binding protein
MINRLLVPLAVTVGLSLAAAPAAAHPHVWVVMKSELAYAPDGSVTGVRHAWTFDDMFSTFATQGLEQKTKGVFTREELAPLAEVNVTSLKEFEYFTYAKIDDKKVALSAAKDYWLDFKDNSLILHFTLALPEPVKAKSLNIEIYDPSYYVDFAFAEKDAVSLAGAPAACKLAVTKPGEMGAGQGQRLGEAFFNSLTSSSNWGAQFANRVTVTCP